MWTPKPDGSVFVKDHNILSTLSIDDSQYISRGHFLTPKLLAVTDCRGIFALLRI